MQIVGLTGGISTGKSSVSHFISTSNTAVIDADLIAREVVQPGQVAYHLIQKHFGDRVIGSDGGIDRGALGAIIFSNKNERTKLNGITHPRIRVILLKRILCVFLTGKAMVVLDIPLLFESGLNRWVNSTVVVYW